MAIPGGPADPDDDDEELLDLAEHFGQVDADGDRRIDFAEFSRLVEDLSEENMPLEERRIGFQEIDTDRDGVIDFHEFVAWWREV
jgi:Ca2+-binding EF-hand superfamily protein